MSQYKDLYCDSGLVGWADSHVATRLGQAATWSAGRPRHGREGEPRHGAGRGALTAQQGCARGLRHGSLALRHGRPWPQHGRAKGHDTATVHAPGRAWVPSLASWVLVHLTQFFDLVFDSVLFLSHHLDSVHEHCS